MALDNTVNRIERFLGLRGEAKVRFMAGEFQVQSTGDFVRCAVTGNPIPLSELKYWNVERQEAYASAEIAMRRYKELRRKATA